MDTQTALTMIAKELGILNEKFSQLLKELKAANEILKCDCKNNCTCKINIGSAGAGEQSEK